MPSNPSSDRLVVWNETEEKLEDVIRVTIAEIREERSPALDARYASVTIRSPYRVRGL